MPRTPEYNRAAVVSQAMAVFWERGYNRTSIGDLVDATGLQPGSLYAAFGNKQGVFLEVLDEYNRTFRANIRSLATGGSPTIEALRHMLDGIVEELVEGTGNRGCLAINALLEIAHHDTSIAERLQCHTARIHDSFADILRRAQANGELPESKDADAMASFLFNNLMGMRIMCVGKANPAALRGIVDGVMDSLTAH